jgi:GAF domain-containing protein
MTLETATRLAELVAEIASQPDLPATFAEIVDRAQEAVAADAAGLMMRYRKTVEAIASTDPIVARADDLQVQLGEGPCRDVALSDPDHILITDTSADRRWPRWSSQVAEWGWASTLSLKLHTVREVLGSLNLYSHHLDAFSNDDIEVADLFARHASIVLAGKLEFTNLREAISARTVIGQAQGLLMERYGIGPDQAFAVLSRYSQTRNQKLRQIAELLVAHRRLPGEPGKRDLAIVGSDG